LIENIGDELLKFYCVNIWGMSMYYDYYCTFEHDCAIGLPKSNYNGEKFVVWSFGKEHLGIDFCVEKSFSLVM